MVEGERMELGMEVGEDSMVGRRRCRMRIAGGVELVWV